MISDESRLSTKKLSCSPDLADEYLCVLFIGGGQQKFGMGNYAVCRRDRSCRTTSTWQCCLSNSTS